jgi:hypothetical protein
MSENIKVTESSFNTNNTSTRFQVYDHSIYILSTTKTNCTHKACGVVQVHANLAINFNQASHDDHDSFAARKRILQAIAQNYRQRQAFGYLVRAL